MLETQRDRDSVREGECLRRQCTATETASADEGADSSMRCMFEVTEEEEEEMKVTVKVIVNVKGKAIC